MSRVSHTIVDMAEVWDDLTPRQQQFMIQRARYLAGYNKMQANGLWKGKELYNNSPELRDERDESKTES